MRTVTVSVQKRYEVSYSFIEAVIGEDDGGPVWVVAARQFVDDLIEFGGISRFEVDGELNIDL